MLNNQDNQPGPTTSTIDLLSNGQNSGWRRLASSVLATGLAILVGGCAVVPNTDPGKTLMSGSGDIFGRDFVEDQNLCTVLQQFGLATLARDGETVRTTGLAFVRSQSIVNTAICQVNNASSPEKRNLFQDYVMALSNQRCGAYKRQILDRRASWQLFFGGWATVLAGAGAVFSPESTAKALSAGSGVLSGIRSEYDQAYFSNLATEVITAGIDQRRREIEKEINERRLKAGDSVETYTVTGALRDALRYHSACSAVAGLEVAKDSISLNEDPGLTGLNKALSMLGFEVDGLTLVRTAAGDGADSGEKPDDQRDHETPQEPRNGDGEN